MKKIMLYFMVVFAFGIVMGSIDFIAGENNVLTKWNGTTKTLTNSSIIDDGEYVNFTIPIRGSGTNTSSYGYIVDGFSDQLYVKSLIETENNIILYGNFNGEDLNDSSIMLLDTTGIFITSYNYTGEQSAVVNVYRYGTEPYINEITEWGVMITSPEETATAFIGFPTEMDFPEISLDNSAGTLLKINNITMEYTGASINFINQAGIVNVSGNLVIGGNISVKRPYGMFSSVKNQTVTNTTFPYNMSFEITEDSYLITKTNNTTFSFLQNGDYLIELSIIAQSSTPGERAQIWIRKNGADIPRSNTIYDFKNANSNAVISVPFIIDMNTTDTFTVMYAGSNTGIKLASFPATTYSPSTPSAIMTISKISEIT